jgi:hypothetical protein
LLAIISIDEAAISFLDFEFEYEDCG